MAERNFAFNKCLRRFHHQFIRPTVQQYQLCTIFQRRTQKSMGIGEIQSNAFGISNYIVKIVFWRFTLLESFSCAFNNILYFNFSDQHGWSVVGKAQDDCQNRQRSSCGPTWAVHRKKFYLLIKYYHVKFTTRTFSFLCLSFSTYHFHFYEYSAKVCRIDTISRSRLFTTHNQKQFS